MKTHGVWLSAHSVHNCLHNGSWTEIVCVTVWSLRTRDSRTRKPALDVSSYLSNDYLLLNRITKSKSIATMIMIMEENFLSQETM